MAEAPSTSELNRIVDAVGPTVEIISLVVPECAWWIVLVTQPFDAYLRAVLNLRWRQRFPE